MYVYVYSHVNIYFVCAYNNVNSLVARTWRCLAATTSSRVNTCGFVYMYVSCLCICMLIIHVCMFMYVYVHIRVCSCMCHVRICDAMYQIYNPKKHTSRFNRSTLDWHIK
jgi:hypothetical protein